MALGLCSVPDESKVAAGSRVSRQWQSAIDREVGRRIWYCLVRLESPLPVRPYSPPQLELDWLYSMEYGFLYIISPEVNQSSEPANIHDADLKDDELVVELPSSTYTEMSYFRQRLRILYPFRSIVQKARHAGRMHYAFILECVSCGCKSLTLQGEP